MAIIFSIIFLIASAAMRVGQFVPNFVPVGALALWSGVYLPKRYAFFVPIAAMFVSDIFVGFYDLRMMIAVYGSFALITLIGVLFKKQKSTGTMLAGSVMGSVIFFGVTNLAVWLWSGMYPHTITGLLLCYEMAIPFFHNTFVSDLVFNGMFFGAYGLALLAPRVIPPLTFRKSDL